MITVTLKEIENSSMDDSSIEKILSKYSSKDLNSNKPVSLLEVLDSVDYVDTLFLIRDTKSMDAYSGIWQEFSCWCAMQVDSFVHLYCSISDKKEIVDFICGQSNKFDAAHKSSLNALSIALSKCERDFRGELSGWTLPETLDFHISASEKQASSMAQCAYSFYFAVMSKSSKVESAYNSCYSALHALCSGWGFADEQKEKLRDLINSVEA